MLFHFLGNGRVIFTDFVRVCVCVCVYVILGCMVSLLLHRLSLVKGCRGYSLLVVRGLLAVASLVEEHRL